MSDKIDVAYVEIEPDFSSFGRNVEAGVRDGMRSLDRQVERAVDEVEDEFADLGDEIADSIGEATDEITKHVNITAEGMTITWTNAAGELVDEFGNALETTSDEFTDLERKARAAFEGVGEQARKTSEDIDESVRDTSETVEDDLGGSAEEASKGFRGLADDAIGAATDIKGSMIGAAGAAGVGALIAAVIAATEAFFDMGREALELEGDIIRITQSTASGFSTAGVDNYREALLGLQTEYGVLTEDLIPALDTAISQGVPEDNVIAFLEQATQSAVASGEDLTDTVSVINGLMAQYEGEFASAAEATDFLTATLRNTTTDAADVGDVLGEVSGFARDAGLGVEEVSAAFAAMSVTGRDAGTSGGQLAALIEELGDSTTPVAEAFNELTGQSFQDFIAQGGNLQQAAQIIADGAAEAGVSVVELASSAETSSAILALSTEAGADRYAEAMADIVASTGTTEQSFGELEQSGALAFSQLEGALATLRDEAGAAVAPIVADFVDGLIPILKDVSPLIQAVGKLFTSTFSLAMTFLPPLIDLVIGLFEAISPLLEALSPLFDILALIGEIVGTILAPVFDVLFAILTPIFELIGLLLTPALEFLRLIFEGIAAVLETYVSPAIEWLAEQIEGWLAPAIDWVTGRINILKAAFSVLVGWVKDNWGGISAAIELSVGKIKGFFEGLVSVAKGSINLIIGAWNAIDFGFSVSIPSWVPEIGGRTFSIPDLVPDIPMLQTGGFITNEGLALLHPDEMVLPLSNANGINALADALQTAGLNGANGDVTVIVKIGERELTDIVDTEVSRNNRTLTRRARTGTGRN